MYIRPEYFLKEYIKSSNTFVMSVIALDMLQNGMHIAIVLICTYTLYKALSSKCFTTGQGVSFGWEKCSALTHQNLPIQSLDGVWREALPRSSNGGMTK